MITRRQFLASGSGAAAALLAGCAHPGVDAGGAASRQHVGMVPTIGVNGAASLAAHAERAGTLYGCAVQPSLLAKDDLYAELVAAQCDILVPENAMKWGALRPSLGQFDFDEADAVLRFAEAHRMKLRGHTLVWHDYLPKWFAGTINKSNARLAMVDHIQTVCGRYAGRMHSWDVVNEAVWLKDGRADGLRKSPWLELIGDDYIELAFRTARLADPQALLCYNEFGIEMDTYDNQEKRAAVMLLLRRLKARGVPVDAVGIQSHLQASEMGEFTGDGVRGFIAEARGLGLQVFLTEMDVSDAHLSGDQAKVDHAVADAYGKYLKVALADPTVTAVLTWGITDKYTWMSWDAKQQKSLPVRVLPFDSEYRPVEAFYAVRDAFDERRRG